MLNKTMLCGLALIAFTALTQAEWVQQHSGSNILYDLDFPQGNIQNGFACGENSCLLKTSDGGDHWEEIRANPSGNYNAICFPTEMNGFIACDSGNVQMSTDGGENWELVNLGTENALNDIHFPADPNFGYVVGIGGVVKKTMDGGRNWEDVPIPSTEDLYAVCFRNPEIGYVVGENGTILFTSDGGQNWTQQNSNVTTRLLDVYMLDENNAWVVGTNSTCLVTSNGGQTWNSVTLPIPSTDLYSITFPDANTGFICGTLGRIIKTTDGGNTWELNTTLFYHFYRIEFPRDALVGWVCGLSEAIYYTNDGGGIFEKPLNQAVGLNQVTCSPNPFRTKTVIRYPFSVFRAPGEFRIYNTTGKLVKSISLVAANGEQQAVNGIVWDGRNEAGQRVSPGVYLLEYKSDDQTQHLKLTVLE